MNDNISIRVENASIFQRENMVLSHVNLSVTAGDFVYLVGKVGSGKSSLIKTLNAEIPLYQGKARVLDYKLDEIKSKEIPLLRRKLGVVFQDFKLLTDRTVYANLLFVLKATGWTDAKGIDARIDEILTEVGMPDVKQKMPHQLSGGEQQRIVIARALLNNPEIILADEPTGNLDPDTSVEIMELFNKIHGEGKTILMATHDQLIINQFPHVVLLCEDGTVKDFSKSKTPLNFRDIIQ